MNHLIIGMGEIGKAVHGIFPDAQTLDKKKQVVGPLVDVMHICFPYTTDFVNQVDKYLLKFQPEHLIIYSTLPIGTTKKISDWAVHSPVEGRHPNLERSIRTMTRWLGTPNEDEALFFQDLFADKGIETRWVNEAKYTEFLKLRSTARYGINLVFADYEKKVADKIGMDFELLKDFDRDYNALYRKLAPWAQRYILDPPEGKIGGHCVTPNAELLDDQYPSELLKMIKEMR